MTVPLKRWRCYQLKKAKTKTTNQPLKQPKKRSEFRDP